MGGHYWHRMEGHGGRRYAAPSFHPHHPGCTRSPACKAPVFMPCPWATDRLLQLISFNPDHIAQLITSPCVGQSKLNDVSHCSTVIPFILCPVQSHPIAIRSCSDLRPLSKDRESLAAAPNVQNASTLQALTLSPCSSTPPPNAFPLPSTTPCRPGQAGHRVLPAERRCPLHLHPPRLHLRPPELQPSGGVVLPPPEGRQAHPRPQLRHAGVSWGLVHKLEGCKWPYK